ncbi:MAG: hypothetical protein Q3998_04560 [Porphyromonas sp.]|nr:hypothetical protein [Porphyromonas sp.]
MKRKIIALLCGILLPILSSSCGDRDLFSQDPEIRIEEKGGWVFPLGYADVGIGEVLLGHNIGGGALEIDQEADKLVLRLEDPDAFRLDFGSFTARQIEDTRFAFRVPDEGYFRDAVIPGNNLELIREFFPNQSGHFLLTLSDKIKSTEKIVINGEVRLELSNVPVKGTFELVLLNVKDAEGNPVRLLLKSSGTKENIVETFVLSNINLPTGKGNKLKIEYNLIVTPEASSEDIILKKGDAVEVNGEVLKAKIEEFKGVIDPTELSFHMNTSNLNFEEWSKAQSLKLKGTKFDLTLKTKGIDVAMSASVKLKSLKKGSSIPIYIPPIKVLDIKGLKQEDTQIIRYDGDLLEKFLSALDNTGMEVDAKVIIPTRGKIAFNSDLSLAGGYRLEQPLDLYVEKFPVRIKLPLSSLSELARVDGLYDTVSLCIVSRSNIPFEIVCEELLFLDFQGKEIPGATIKLKGGLKGSDDGKTFSDSRIVVDLTVEQSKLIQKASKVKVQGYFRTLSEETVQVRPSQSIAVHVSAGINHKF